MLFAWRRAWGPLAVSAGLSVACAPAGETGTHAGGAGGVPAGGAESGGGGSAGAGGSLTEPYPEVEFPKENPFSEAKAVLGKILFWDEQLSGDASVACGTCHRPSAGGSDPRSGSADSVHPGKDGQMGTADDVHGSKGIARCDVLGSPKDDAIFGFAPQVTARKAPSTFDAMFAPKLFWDGRAGTQFIDPVDQTIVVPFGAALESQSAAPLLNNVEMSCEGRTWFDLEAKVASLPPLAKSDPASHPPDIQAALAASATYAELFEAAFPGDGQISTRNILLAIATYERTLVSNQTPWDAFVAGDTGALTTAQQHGLELFNDKGKCSSCHPPPLFTDSDFHDIGVTDPAFDDGREDVTHKESDKGKMKTPSLRNVGSREGGGLLHGGAAPGGGLALIMYSLNEGGTFPANLDPEVAPLGLSEDEIADIIDFVQNGLADPRVVSEQPPFDRPKLKTEE